MNVELSNRVINIMAKGEIPPYFWKCNDWIVKQIVGKEEIAHYEQSHFEQFLFLPQCFQICLLQINHFPHYRRFLTPLQQMAFLKTLWHKKKLLKMCNFFCHHIFNSIQLLFFHSNGFSVLLPRRFRSRLLQICCMRERVKWSYYQSTK